MEVPANDKPTKYVNVLKPDDVLLGRGRHIRHKGNSKFRALVQARVVEYVTSRNKSTKDAITRDIIASVRNSGGRFVKPVAPVKVEIDAETTPVWEIADESTVLLKVKQTIRDYSVVARRAAAASSDQTQSTSSRTQSRQTENGTTQSNVTETNNLGPASTPHTSFSHSSCEQSLAYFPVENSEPPLPAEAANTIASSSMTARQWIDNFSHLHDSQSLNLFLQQQGLTSWTIQQPAPPSFPGPTVVGAPESSLTLQHGGIPSFAVHDINEALIRNQLVQRVAGQNIEQNLYYLSATPPAARLYLQSSAGLPAVAGRHPNLHNVDEGHH